MVMAEAKENSEVKPNPPLPFLEVLCKCSGEIRRFSVGTEAGFAVNLINKKLLNDSGGGGDNVLMASYIEAVKEEEEHVSFGHGSLLVDYGPGWKLQTVLESRGDKGGAHFGTTRARKVSSMGIDDSLSRRRKQTPPISFVYIGKILLALLLIFVFGAIFTLALENLPRLILYINSSL